jgi:hypothetical protein
VNLFGVLFLVNQRLITNTGDEMSYINVGAKTLDGRAIMTKGELKKRMSEAPMSVNFYSTEYLGPHAGQQYNGGNLPKSFSLSVVGPDPERSRKWYATVTADGKVS